MIDKYIIINLENLTQDILDASSTNSPYDLKVSASDSSGQKFVILRFKNGIIPLSALSAGGVLKTKAEVSQIEETSPIWQEQTELISTKALQTDGIVKHINFNNNFNYDVATAFSIALMVYPNNFSSQRAIFSKATVDTAVNGFMTYIRTDGKVYLQARCPSGLRSFVFDQVLTSMAWNFIVLTYAGGSNINGFKLYTNGVLNTIPASGSLPNSWLNGQDFLVGRRGAGFNFSGKVRELTAWNKELSQSEVNTLYNAGELVDPKSVEFSNNLDSYHKLGTGDVAPTATATTGGFNGDMQGMDSNDIVGI